MGIMLPYSVTCKNCNVNATGTAPNAFEFIKTQTEAGWLIPDAIQNQAILCPSCRQKSRGSETLQHLTLSENTSS